MTAGWSSKPAKRHLAVHASDPDLKALSIDVGREDARAGPPGQRAA